jgi:hypothetical protein
VVDRQRVAALLAEAKWLARRLGLTGRPARWIGTFLAVARRPRLSGIVLAALAARWRSAERGAAARRPDADRRVSE